MSSDGSPPTVQVNRSLLAGGGVLIGIGSLLGFTGMALVLLCLSRGIVLRVMPTHASGATSEWTRGGPTPGPVYLAG